MRTLKPKAPVTFAQMFLDVVDRLDGPELDDVQLSGFVVRDLTIAAKCERSDQEKAHDPEPDRKLHIVGHGCDVTTAVHDEPRPADEPRSLRVSFRDGDKHIAVKMPIAVAKLLVMGVSHQLVTLGEAFESELPDNAPGGSPSLRKQIAGLDETFLQVADELRRAGGAQTGDVVALTRAAVDELLRLRELTQVLERSGELLQAQNDQLRARWPEVSPGEKSDPVRATFNHREEAAARAVDGNGEKFDPLPSARRKPRAKKKPADQLDIETAAAQSESEARS